MKNFDLLEKLSFERVAGSKEEYQAMAIIKEEVEKYGVQVEIEPFSIEFAEEVTAAFEVLTPTNELFEVTGVGMASSGELEAEFLYIDALDLVSLAQAKDKIVLFNGGITYASYKKIIEAQVAGFITFNGDCYDDQTDVEERYLRPQLQELGKIPGVTMSIRDAERLVRMNPQRVKMSITSRESTRTSHNIVATIPGDSQEIIAFTAHYDSVRHSKGVYDNATGVLAVFDFFTHFVKTKPKRTLKFIWCGAEERGLCGSTAYVKAHQEELSDYRLVINIDMLGAVLGHDVACATATEAVIHYVDFVANELGHGIKISQGVYPSDSTPFADGGVPALTFARGAAPGGPVIHSKKDVVDFLSIDSFNKSVAFIIAFASRIIDAKVMPIPQEISEKMKEELDIYLLRKEK
jgi:predicted SnoaL-like aldol condensation-catalyzing enzyme